MNPYDLPPLTAVLDGASRLIEQLAALLSPLAGASSAALAIVVVTMLVRTVLIPVGISQLRAQRMRARLAPRIRTLQQRHRADPQRLQRELSALYAAEKASPLAGCLPMLAQAPVLAVVYAVFSLPMIAGHANPLLAQTLLGAPLGQGLVAAAGSGSVTAIVVCGAVVAVVLVVALLSRRLQQRSALLGTDAAGAGDRPRGGRRTSVGDGAGAGDRSRGDRRTSIERGGRAGDPTFAPGNAGLASALSWMPLLSVVFAALAPLAAALYLATSMTWTLAERAVLPHLLPA